jgi:F-type H+-transporting ATPase subunit gamma
MPSLKAIRTRIVSVKSTQKITRAIKMVAGARLNRAQQRIVALRPYAVKTGEIVQSVAASIGLAADGTGEPTEGVIPSEKDGPTHPLLARRPEARVLVIVLSGDRGLCGAFNTNVNKASERLWREKEAAGATVEFATIGRKGREYMVRRGGKIARDFPRLYDGLDLGKGRMVADWMVGHFLKKDFDSVYLVYNEFKSAITQKVAVERLLPLPDLPKKDAPDGGTAGAPAPEFLFEPNPAALLERLVPMYVEISLYRSMLESQASFFGAQMTAMDSATRNAKDTIGRLTLAYNRARQAAITKELMEIIGGAEALKE